MCDENGWLIRDGTSSEALEYIVHFSNAPGVRAHISGLDLLSCADVSNFITYKLI